MGIGALVQEQIVDLVKSLPVMKLRRRHADMRKPHLSP